MTNAVRTNLPKGWGISKLSELSLVDWGNTNLTKKSYVENGKYLAISATGADGRINHAEYKAGTPVLSAIGARCGVIFSPKEDFTAIKNTITFVPVEDRSDARFLYYFLSHVPLPKRGGAQPFISKGDLQNLAARIPKVVSEQQKIAGILGAVDEDIEKTKEVIAATERLKKGLMQQLFTRGIGHTEFKEMELGKIAIVSTGTTPSTNKPSYYEGSNPFIKTGAIINERIFDAEVCISNKAIQDYRLKIYKPGTILVAMYGQGKTRGQSALLEIEACTTQNAAAIEPNDVADAEYLWFYLRSQYDSLRESGVQGHISHLSLSFMKKLLIPFPDIRTQKAIAKVISSVDGKITADKKSLAKLTELKKGLMQDLLSGKVRVCV